MESKQAVLAAAAEFFEDGLLQKQLERRITYRTESQNPEQADVLQAYLDSEIGPELAAMGFTLMQIENPVHKDCPFLIATRIEDPALPTVLCYGHGDVVFGDADHWRTGLTPWQLVAENDRWYGRGSADNKGQHTINFAALAQVYQARAGRLGFNCKVIFEMGEEIGSPGLKEVCTTHQTLLAADLFIASDGPRLQAERPTLFLGSRGAINIRLSIQARSRDYHSGNWGGLLSNPGTQLANAIATLVNGHGELLVDTLKPPAITSAMREILRDVIPGGNPGDPEIDSDWGATGMTPAERLFAWNTLEVLTFITGNPEAPMNAIPSHATAVCQLRCVVGTDWQNIAMHLREHLAAAGFGMVKVDVISATPPTRFDPQHPLVNWTLALIKECCHKQPTLLPNLGGSLPNDVFADVLDLPTLWIPHSYPACGQHGVDEHMLTTIAKEGLLLMTTLFWALGEEVNHILLKKK